MKIGLVVIALLACFYPLAASATDRYVDITSTHPVSPYTGWATAATNIQDAINVAGFSDTIWVNDGVYQSGSVNFHGNSRLNTTGRHLLIQSVNGPEVTFIKGLTNGSVVRCAYLTDGAMLAGFTLTNGGALAGGAGVFCETANCIVTNCAIVGCFDQNVYGGGGANGGTLLGCSLSNNTATSFGGGANSNILINCILMSNRGGTGGGAYRCSLTNCLLVGNTSVSYGGGAVYSFLDACTVSNNAATSYGGGLCYSTANNTLISSNRANSMGGGAYLIPGATLMGCSLQTNYSTGSGGGAYSPSSTCGLTNCWIGGNIAGTSSTGGGASGLILNNCVLVGNIAHYGAGVDGCLGINCTVVGNIATGSGYGAGAYFSTLYNSIIYYNQAITNADNYHSVCYHCCAPWQTDFPAYLSLTNEPSFVDPAGDFHLQSDSPCINAGNNIYALIANDFDGNPRIAGDTVDVGAYEYQYPSSLLSYAWLQQYGLPTDGSADYTDDDNDGVDNWHEWMAFSDPTDANSFLQMTAATPANDGSGVNVSWQSVSGKLYLLERSADLPAFTFIKSNLVGQAGTTTYKDTDAVGKGPFYYRVATQ